LVAGGARYGRPAHVGALVAGGHGDRRRRGGAADAAAVHGSGRGALHLVPVVRGEDRRHVRRSVVEIPVVVVHSAGEHVGARGGATPARRRARVAGHDRLEAEVVQAAGQLERRVLIVVEGGGG